MNILKVQNVSKTYGKGEQQVQALNNISFEVEQGEFVAIVGTSGSGKSTLLHILGGVDRPDQGSVIIEDTDIFGLNNSKLAVFRRRQIGIIYQFYNLIPVLNVEENMTLPIDLDQQKVDQEYLEELIKMLGLERRRNHLPSELSGGQQQRVSIGRAILAHPALLLADEPTGNLDSKNRNEVMQILKRANKEYHQTLILITHDESIALQADRIITMADGEIISDEKIRDSRQTVEQGKNLQKR